MPAFSDSDVLQHLCYHIFLPPKLPQEEQQESFQRSVDFALAESVKEACERFGSKAGGGLQWTKVGLMLGKLCKYIESSLEKVKLSKDIKSMKEGDILALYVKAQNAGLIIRKQATHTVYEVFEVQAQTEHVMSTPAKIVRSFPGPTVQISNSVASDQDFINEVANILSQMNNEIFDEAYPKSRKAGKDASESRNSINPNYFIQYFFGFLQGMGSTSNPTRTTKRLADEVLWKNAQNPWRRSPIWLIIRVALQTSLDSRATYKHFMTYYHASILSESSKHDSFSSDLLYAMRVKMARRLYKIKDTAPQFLIDTAKAAADETQCLLQGRWDAVQSVQAQSRSPDLSRADFSSATHQTLPNSRAYLDQVFGGRSSHTNPSKFSPSHSARLENVTEFSQYADGGLSRAHSNDPHLALFDFEASVFNNLSAWTSRQSDYPQACAIMSSCFHQYLKTAKTYYSADIADQSIMILTLIRIWKAIDELATRDSPLLSRFSPEISDDILDPLLLRTGQHIEQARRIQEYISSRRKHATSCYPSIFSDNTSSSSFAVQFFRSSSSLQEIKQKIESHAQEQKDNKIRELKDLNAQHARLGREIEKMSCDYTYYDGWRKHDKRWCTLCSKTRERSDLTISPYEWPLPRNQLEAEAVVFELHRPQSFAIWRDITYEILVDLGTESQRDECEKYSVLETYSPLSSWLSNPSVTPRITIASSTKSWMQSHYSGTIHIPSTESEVCLNNALQFKLYDGNGDAWAAGPFIDVTFAKYGTLKLPPKSPYHHLEYALEKTTHTSNQILADQHDCPMELSLHEHIAFGTLRSGARLQWMNIVRGLEEDLLTFSSDEVLLLHTQAVWQIGPLSGGSREWHKDLGDVEFGRLVVSQCKRMLDRVKANWLQANSVLIIVTLVNRLLSSSPQAEVACAACGFLCEARTVSHEWLRQLLDKLKDATLEDDVIAYQFRVCKMAAICCATYDTESNPLNLLLATPEDYAALIKAFISLYDNQPPDIRSAPKSLQIALCRHRRFAHKVAQYMLTSIRRGDDILSNPLSKIWPDYCQGSGWRVLAAPNSRWITTTTAEINGSRTQEVHLNSVTGQLLIDGKPLGRLPRQYVEHPTYIRLFGQKILDVVPAKSAGMEFATRGHVEGYQISFALEESNGQLIIQAQKGDRLYELIPHKTLCKDFPRFFSEDYHHWADCKNQTVGFRPISSPWSTDDCKWVLRFGHPYATSLKHSTDDCLLIDIHSAVFKSLSRSLTPLESDRYLHVTRSPRGRVDIELPRMKLSFFVNEDVMLESRNFRDQVLDENQSAGTLFGLENQLLLRAKNTMARTLPQSRTLLIPDGDITCGTDGHHISVSIQFDSRRDVDVYPYKIDNDLGYLVTDAGLTSRLFKIYLHALTSNCLPDPLTGRTGTEEALHELSQASTSSFEQINVKQAGLLKAIGLLTPKREYYPQHLQRMQTTHWKDLPSLSQHFAFSSAATTVLRRADTLQLFHPLDFKVDDYISALNQSDILLKRTARQTGVYYPPDTTGYNVQIIGSTAISDRVCSGRDSLAGEWEEKGQAARWASSLAHRNWRNPVYTSSDLVTLAESWGTLNDPKTYESLAYRSSWFRVSLNSSWINLYNLLREAQASSNRYILSSFLAGIAFGQAVSADLIPVFLAFATNPEFRNLDPPSQKSFKFKDQYEPIRAHVERFVSSETYSMESSPARNLTRNNGETDYELCNRRVKYYDSNLPNHRLQFVDSLMNQWPRTNPQPSIQIRSRNSEHSRWFDVRSCVESTRQYFSSCIWNIRMRDHLRDVQQMLADHTTSPGMAFARVYQKPVDQPIASKVLSDPWHVFNISGLMHSRSIPEPTDILLFSKFSVPKLIGSKPDTSRLQQLFAEFHNQDSLKKQYGKDLDQSRLELDSKPAVSRPRKLSPEAVTALDKTRKICEGNLANAFQRINSLLSPITDIERVVSVAGVWPRITPRTVLQELSFKNRHHLDSLPNWRDELIGYAQVFADYQRCQRLVALAESGNTEEFHKELDLASSGSDPGLDDPDWLLVQIDGNFGARSLQRRVAQEMISPSSGSNTTLQLNMGEGKSSVIVPIIAASLANSSRLVRVIVLKPLWRQMFDLLVSRLSGLSNRRIYYLPFGRHLRIDASSAQQLHSLYKECMREGGVLLAQPEHILSFKLMAIDRLISSHKPSDISRPKPSDITVATTFRGIQDWLKNHARDVLDESDEILHVRYQLVYTIGAQKPLDNHPDRWTTTQQLLRLAAAHIEALQRECPNSLSYKHRDHGRFPILRIMPDCSVKVEQRLISAVATDVCNGRLLNLSCDRLPRPVRDTLAGFFTKKDIPFSDYDLLRRHCDSTMWKGLLLVRGLLASGILIFALKHRHNRVDYGLDLSRSLLAVPYRAKDIPSLRAEFGHPDVAIVLTCLSYYYQGLTAKQLDLCFELLFKVDNPALEYEQWVQRDDAIPNDLKQLNGVNVKDGQQFRDLLVPTFSYNSATIDFFLSSVVFPREAKEFPEKLATSGWDLAERKTHVTTGFSGTNDNRYLLPTSISQVDPVNQLSTNALVLTYLLQPENNYCVCMRDKKGGNLSTKGFLKLLVSQKPEVRVLLDVGAQMLELQNEELVRCWLGLRQDIKAAIYFNDRDELVVLPQEGTPVLLKTSPFAYRLDECIVYLDDGHTRGTDLKLPRETRAMVTLGPKVTKDRLLQGCMRMRKLGHGQSVMFAAPPEIDNQIRNTFPNTINPDGPVDTIDVLRWAMLQTCKDLQHHVSHWARQGIEFEQRLEAERLYEVGKPQDITTLQKGWTTPESRSLEEMYGVPPPDSLSNRASFVRRAFAVPELRKGMEKLGVEKLDDPSMDEEQEREVNHEVEKQQQIERPPKGQASNHSIHPDVRQFIREGTLPQNPSGVSPLFYPFRALNPQVFNSWSPLLFASADFLQTIVTSPSDRISDYMRPVNWIVSGVGEIRVILSPHEVNELLPLIRDSSVVRLHIYAPRVSLAMLSFSDLQFYSIPASPRNHLILSVTPIARLQLDLFAGQLYLSSYQDYVSLCTTLGLFIPSGDDADSSIEVESDGFVKPGHRHQLIQRHGEYSECRFTTTPIPILRDLVGRRRKGMRYLRTHIGQILHGRSLTPNDF